jgi:hypothetical protein
MSDLRVGEAIGDLGEHLDLSLGQGADQRLRRTVLEGYRGNVVAPACYAPPATTSISGCQASAAPASTNPRAAKEPSGRLAIKGARSVASALKATITASISKRVGGDATLLSYHKP